jgi:hypothetical protein
VRHQSSFKKIIKIFHLHNILCNEVIFYGHNFWSS